MHHASKKSNKEKKVNQGSDLILRQPVENSSSIVEVISFGDELVLMSCLC